MKTIIAIIICLLIGSTLQAQVNPDMLTENSAPQSFITLQGATINSIGEFKESWDKGSGIYAGYAWLYSNQFALVLESGYIDFQMNDQMNYEENPSFSVIPIAVGVRYYIFTQRFRPFLLAMSGANIVNQKYTEGTEVIDKSSVHLHFQIGIGLGVLIVKQLELEGQAKYNSHILEASQAYNMTGLEYGIALNWHL